MRRITLWVLAIPAFISAIAVFPVINKNVTFHTEAELVYFLQHGFKTIGPAEGPGGPLEIPIDSNILFPTGKVCGGCHGYDPNMHALITTSGVDVNIYDDWRSTMMANSARDPFWRAKVTHEILVNPAHSLELQDKCTSCHAPGGHYQAKLHDHQTYYTLADLYADTLGLDGVSCQVCHAQSPDRLGELFSGALNFDTNYLRVSYGPYPLVFAPPMHQFVGITPLFGEHMGDAGLCAGCHTLITATVDQAGAYTGTTFVEQATYHEWLNSRYDEDHDNVTCQGCHVPKLADEIIISANYQFLTPKFPFFLHELAGANVTMLQLMRDHRTQLGITATPAQFDSTIAASLRMLQQKSVDLDLQTGVLSGDTLHFDLQLTNKAGHKFPSGYPSRRAWVEFTVTDQAGNTFFHSGRMDPDGRLPDENPNFEPHYNLINRPDQVQIYELVPGDVGGIFTSVLERGHAGLKDNRLVPQGFSWTDPVYDTTQVIGVAGDPDFNRTAAGLEGSGTDRLHFSIPSAGYTGFLRVVARVWYQSLPPKWMAPMFAYSSPEIDSFKVMFAAADNAPVLVGEVQLDSIFVSAVHSKNLKPENLVSIAPTLCTDGQVWIQLSPQVQLLRVQVFDSNGRLYSQQFSSTTVLLPSARGVYYVAVLTDRGRVVQKIVSQ